jgi:hypothetical protein
MSNPLQWLLPAVGFMGGIILWWRVAHTAIVLSGLTPNPSSPAQDMDAMENGYRRLVLRIGTGWLCVTGAALASLLYHGQIGFALLLSGVFAVPLLAVTNFFVIVRRHKRRAANLRSQPPH